MRGLGGTMFFFGVGSALLTLFEFEFVVLMWIDIWGPTIGWIIRAGLIVIGGALWLIGKAQESQAVQAQQQLSPPPQQPPS